MIFAGTHAQAVDWRKSNGYSQSEAEYIARAEMMRGRSTKGVPRVIVGTFYQRADWGQIQEALLVADLHERLPDA
jgi:hypothetical protein